MKRFNRPSGAVVIAGVALFVSLGGGAYAAVAGSVTHSQLASNSVWHANIGNGSVQVNNLGNGSVGHKNLQANSVWHANIGNHSVQNSNLASGSVQQNNLSADIQAELSKPAPQYGVANVLVSQGAAAPVVWATYSGALGSPVGTTVGGAVRFTCTQAQGPCKVSIAAAVLSGSTGTAHVHASVLITRDVTGSQPDTFCEYAQDADNSHTPATVSLVPMSTTAASIKTPLSMGVGGSLDCKAGQPYSPSVTDIWVPGGTASGGPSYYNVETTFQFVG
jgi:hypothetical protein